MCTAIKDSDDGIDFEVSSRWKVMLMSERYGGSENPTACSSQTKYNEYIKIKTLQQNTL